MEELRLNNIAEICGCCAAAPVYSHSSREEEYMIFPLNSERLSGAIDTINVVFRKGMEGSEALMPEVCITVLGELRSFNNRSGEGSKLVITVFAKELLPGEAKHKNAISLTGALCQPPNYRKTPMGREICDLMLAVNRLYGRTDYLPCIAWGSHARRLSELEVGDRINLEGRIQSRKYMKVEGESQIEKTAYEVSITTAATEQLEA